MTSLTTLARLKRFIGNTDANADDVLLGELIERVSTSIENWLGRSLLSAARTELVDGNGKQKLMFKNWPVTVVSSVKVDGVSIPAASSYTAAGYRFTDQALILQGYSFVTGLANVEMSYTAGYSAIPGDVEQACIETVMLAYKRRDHVDVSSKSLAGETVSFITSELTPSAKTMLQPFKRVVPI